MMKNKNIIAFILVFVLILPLTGCTSWRKQPVSLPTPTPTIEVTPIPTPTPTSIPMPTPTPLPTPEPTSPLPIINKNPTSETVYEGGSCMFVAWYENATIAVWHFVNPEGSIDLTYIQAAKQFPTLKIINGMYSMMTLDNIPLGLNGWKVYCEYSNNNGSMNTGMALITVLPVIIPAPTPTLIPIVEPTPVPTIEPTPVPTVEPTPIPTYTPNPEVSKTNIFKDSAQSLISTLTDAYKTELVIIEVVPETYTINLMFKVTDEKINEIKIKADTENLTISESISKIFNIDYSGVSDLQHLIISIENETEIYYKCDLITNEILYLKMSK